MQLVHHSELLKVHRNAWGNHPLALLEGRESNIWAATDDGPRSLSRIRWTHDLSEQGLIRCPCLPAAAAVPQREAVRC